MKEAEDSYYSIKDRCSNSELGRIKREILGQPPLELKEDTLYFGRMFHTALLEPHKYDPMAVDGKSRLMIEAMVQSCRKNFHINFFLHSPHSVFEKPHFFDFEGVPFKMKTDNILHDWGTDAKSTACTTHEDFLATFDSYGYWRQAALYMKGENLKRFTFWGVQKNVNNPKVFIVNAHEFPRKLAEGLEEAQTLTLHYDNRRKKKK